MSVNLDESDDKIIWDYAQNNNYTIVTKDADFNEIMTLKGFPPKIIWLRIGNCKISDIERLIRENSIILNEFDNNKKIGFIEFD